ncbi:MAG: aminotransferase class I/II-fold pyridoxal phosphate-dependent enzyme, partial [Actinomycetota bacterium]|nr:aminotransferase class I/II-fold pyridoxal phosphate-dependent enzyme [Actinomycetota bacterium]
VAAAMARADPLGYTNAPGSPALRRRIARHYAEQYGLTVAVDDVLVVAGASAGFTLAFLAAFDVGARVGVLEPGYPCYRNTLLALGMQPVPIPVGPDTRWAPTAELLAAAGPLDGLVIASPSNPTGTVLAAERLAAVAAWCSAHGVQLIADEIYHGITYQGPAATVLAATRDAVLINSFSKYFSMTGWRLGWMVVPAHLRDAVERLQQNIYICAPHVSQVAGLAAFDATAELEGHVQRYSGNRTLLVQGLAAAGITEVAEADGAFYVYADVTALADAAGGSMALCHHWLDHLGVAATPGLDFDLARGHRFVRFSYAGHATEIAEACTRLQHWAA